MIQEIIDKIEYIRVKFDELGEVDHPAYDRAIKYINDLYDSDYDWPMPFVGSGCGYGVSLVWEIGETFLDIEIMPVDIASLAIYRIGDGKPVFINAEKLDQIRMILNNSVPLDKQD